MLYVIDILICEALSTRIYTLSLHDALPISTHRPGHPPGPSAAAADANRAAGRDRGRGPPGLGARATSRHADLSRSEEHTSELQSRGHLVCRLLLEKKKT